MSTKSVCLNILSLCMWYKQNKKWYGIFCCICNDIHCAIVQLMSMCRVKRQRIQCDYQPLYGYIWIICFTWIYSDFFFSLAKPNSWTLSQSELSLSPFVQKPENQYFGPFQRYESPILSSLDLIFTNHL